jgi:Mce-associated membrane protein
MAIDAGAAGELTGDEIDVARNRATSSARWAVAVGVVVVMAFTALGGWLGYRAQASHRTQVEAELFVQVARQGALNLTTISYDDVEGDVKRILDSAAGTFHDDFEKRSQPFIEVVKQARSTTVGTVTEAALESEKGDAGQVLVAVTVKTTNVAGPEQAPRAWRMRIGVQKVAEVAKVSHVEFVA